MNNRGLPEKFPPLNLVPTTVPPALAVYHSIELPTDTALKILEEPEQIGVGEARGEMDNNGSGFTVSATSVRLLLTHPVAVVLAAA